MNKIIIEKEIPMDVIENIFVTALEGGSNYWYNVSQETYDLVKKTIIGEPFSVALFQCVCERGMVIPITDAEDEEEVIGHLDYAKFQSRIEKMYKDGNGSYMDLELTYDGDASSSDAIFQYLVMNEIVYG